MTFKKAKSAKQLRRSEWLLPVATLLLIVIEAFAFQFRHRSQVLSANVTANRSVVEHVTSLLTALDDAETGQRGFLLTGQEDYLEPYNSGAALAPGELAALRQSTRYHPAQRARVEAIGVLTAKKLASIGLTIKLFKSFGPEAALKLVKTGAGKQTMDQIRILCRELKSSEYAALTRNSNETERYGKQTFLVTAIGSTALVALLIVALVSIRLANQQRDRYIDQLRNQAFILDQANDTIFIRDSQDRITYWNEGAQRLYGWNKAEALGHVTHALLHTQFPRPLDEIQQRLRAEGCWKGELKHTRRDGSLLTVASYWTLQRDARLSPSVLEINYDITARKEAEQALEKNQQEMVERSILLQAANKELEEFAYVASHDLKAPLRVIDNASKWLEEDLREHLTDETRESMQLLRSRVKRMDRLLDDLLEYGRIGRASDSRFAERISGDLLMDDVLVLVSTENFSVSVSPSFAGIQVCRMPLQQILMNLIANAIKHHHRKQGRIEVTAADAGEYYAFAVKDDGPGIPPQYHDRIFRMFQTLKPRDQVEGSGMGLAMVRKNIAVFGGTMELESAEGQGSTFRFTWPKQQQLVREAA
jgi:PAS domain S-box-containing protein